MCLLVLLHLDSACVLLLQPMKCEQKRCQDLQAKAIMPTILQSVFSHWGSDHSGISFKNSETCQSVSKSNWVTDTLTPLLSQPSFFNEALKPQTCCSFNPLGFKLQISRNCASQLILHQGDFRDLFFPITAHHIITPNNPYFTIQIQEGRFFCFFLRINFAPYWWQYHHHWVSLLRVQQ